MSHRTIIRGDQIAQDDTWVYLDDEATPKNGADVIVSLTRWIAQGDELSRRPSGRLGVVIEPDVDPEQLGQIELFNLDLIAVRFPKFADGRGYSIARLLRERHDWTKELRATGEVLRDQLFFLRRVGFDVLEIAPREGIDPASWLSALGDFGVVYQPSSDGAAPIYAHDRPSGPAS